MSLNSFSIIFLFLASWPLLEAMLRALVNFIMSLTVAEIHIPALEFTLECASIE
jgi:hypothetical protein